MAAAPADKAESATVAESAEAGLPLSPDDSGAEVGLRRPEIYRGTGLLTRQTGSAGNGGIADDGQVTLNFANADIREVVDVVLGDTLGLSYIIDPKVQGTVTARTSQPLERSAVIPVLESILALNGAALTKVNGIYRVVTREEAAGIIGSPTVSPTRKRLARGFGINIIPLEFAAAEEVRNVLQPFVGPGRELRVDSTRNLLIFSGTGAEAADLAEMAEIFDVDWMAGMSFGLFPIDIADAKNMVSELEAIFLQSGASPIGGLIRFVPIERLNAILAISPQAAYLEQVETWIERLDRGEEGVGRRIFVYHVKNGRADEMAEILSEIFDSGTRKASQAPRAEVAPGLTPTELDTRGEPSAEAGAAEAPARERRTANDRPGGETAVASLIEGDSNIRIIADVRINALVVLASSAEYRMIEATLKRLDILPLQVFIEATIADVTLNDELRYGLQWFFNQGDSTATFSTLSTGDVASAFPGFSYLLDTVDARVVLNALTEITDVNVLSSPQLMVLNNHSARLQVGDEVPIATQSAVSIDNPDAPIVNSIQFRDTGVILEVTPRVNASGLVVLEIVQEVSNVVETTTSDLNSPTIQQRRVESTVAVHSGESIALGGLIQDDQSEGISGVPLLSEIPLLGNLFKVSARNRFRRELLIFITPQVVRNRDEAREITQELRRRLRAVAPLELRLRSSSGRIGDTAPEQE